MTDAKGLTSEDEEVIYVKVTKKWERVGDVVNERNALAERLKTCEAILDEIKRQDNTSSLVAKYCELKSERDQLTADLERAPAKRDAAFDSGYKAGRIDERTEPKYERLKVLLEYAEDALRRCGEAGTGTRAYVLIQAALKETP